MPTYIGENKIVDWYLGDKFLEATYIGDQKVYDPYTEITGYLPMIFKSRAAVALKNYRIHGTSAGAGVETENLFYFDEYTIGDTRFVTKTLTLEPNTAYTMSSNAPLYNYGALIVLAAIGESTSTSNSGVYEGRPITKTTNASGKINVGLRDNGSGYDLSTYKTMLIKGSSAPSTYIPPGYKLPLTVESGETINTFELDRFVNGIRMVRGTYTYDASINSITIIATNNDAYTGNDNTYHIPVNPNTKYAVSWTHSGDEGSVYAFENGNISSGYGHSVATTSGRAFSFTTHSDVDYLVLRVGCTVKSTSATYSNIMVTPTDTPPDHYIPHRYTSDTPIYIGDSKLGEEEYVDFGEQKVYKRTENLFDGEWQVGYWALSDGQHRNSTHWVCSLNKFPCVAGSAYSFKYFDNSRYYSIGWYDSNDTYISMDSEQNSDDTGYRTFTAVAPNNAAYITISIGSYPGEYDLIDPSTAATLTLVEGSTAPSSYIPYLQPTDPPVPLPPIPTYKGENTLSSTKTLGEVTVKGRIRELTYRRVEYLKSTGTQYIQTDIVPTNTTKTVLDVEFGTWKLTTHGDSERGLIGADSLSSENKNTEIYRISLLGTTNSSDVRAFSFYAGYGWRNGIGCYLYNPAIPSRNILILQSNMGSWGSASISLTEAKTLREPTLPMPIFGNARLYEATGSIVRSPFKVTNMSLYSCKIYDSGNALSHNLIPVEREDGELGLLDTITNKFYANAGTGTFEKGEYV